MTDCTKLSLILTGVVCGCCVLLCLAVSYLCVVVRRIRRKLNDLTGDGNIHLERANKKDKDGRKRMSSGLRYTGEPLQGPTREPSAVYQSPEETVTRLDLDREVRPETPELIPMQYINKGFSPDSARNFIGESSVEEDDSQPIYENKEAFSEEAINENNNSEDGDEDVYQNTGQLRAVNNPEWDRSNKTMKISQIP